MNAQTLPADAQSLPAPERTEWPAFIAQHPQLTGLDAFIIDINGNALGKRIAIRDAHKVFSEGVQFSSCALFADARGLGHNVKGMGATDGDPDGSAWPIPGTLCVAPWTQAPVAQVMCSMRDVESRSEFWFDPRVVLADVVAQCRAAGIHPVVACELEFYLLSPERSANGGVDFANLPGRNGPPRRAANLSLDAVEEHSSFLNRVLDAARQQGVPVCGAVAEYGIAQHEINLHHVSDPLLAADHAVLLKRIVKGVAQSMNMRATFMAKPFAHQPGSGLHVHVSVVDEKGNNRFGAAGGEQLLQHAIAGMQALMFDSVGICAPNFNSYRRYLGPFVPTTRDWGYNNRSVAFRVPAGAGAARRVEHRVAGADASPHLALAAVLAAVLHGIQNGLKSSEPIKGRVSSGRSAEFPDGLLAALGRIERSATLARYLPAKFLELYVELKRKEFAVLIENVFAAELDFYL